MTQKQRILGLALLLAFSVVLICCTEISPLSGGPVQPSPPADMPALDTSETPVTSDPDPEPDKPVSSGLAVTEQTLSDSIFDEDGEKLVDITLSLPYFTGTDPVSHSLNDYYQSIGEKHMENGRYALADMAAEARTFSGDLFTPYSSHLSYTLYINNGDYLSIVRWYDEFTGGTHGLETVRADNFEANEGGMLTLSDLFSASQEVYMARIFSSVQEQIASTPDIYFENARETLSDAYDPADFFLSDAGLGLFFQAYSIGPYSSGLPVFIFPYSAFSDILKPEVYDGLTA